MNRRNDGRLLDSKSDNRDRQGENVSRGETFELWGIAISSHVIQLGNQHNGVPNVFGVVDWFDLLGFQLRLFDKIVGAHW